jgi:glucan endo-1,3-alpha-glucosidase
MSYSWSTGDIVNIVSSHAASSATYKWNGQVLVSTFSGKANGNSFYANVKSSLATKGYNIAFAPALIDYRDASQASQMLSDFPVVDGFFNWWSWSVSGHGSLNGL